MIVRRVIKTERIVPGGGAIEMELSKLLRMHSKTVSGKEHLIFYEYAKALEIIPRCLAVNGGLEVNKCLNQLRRIHAKEKNGNFFGVNVFGDESVCNTYLANVWEPLLVKKNYLQASNEAACLILSIDETVKAP
jgi:T-complex protein 1 subunit eta